MIKNQKNKIKKGLIEFIPTFIVGIILSFLIALAFELNLMFKCEDNILNLGANIQKLSEHLTIEQYENLLKRYPNNSLLYIKIAQQYEKLHELNTAQYYYSRGLASSHRSNYALYMNALFYANKKDYIKSSTLCEELSYTKDSINYRAKIYEAIADNLYKDKEYLASVKAYQISRKYAKNLKNKKFYSDLIDKNTEAYIKLADTFVAKEKTYEAIFALNQSLELKNTNTAQYKLSLIYTQSDKPKAEQMMYKVLNHNPYMVNPHIYNKLLNDLIIESKLNNTSSRIKYYESKREHFKNRLEKIYLYKGDINITNIKLSLEKKWYSKKTKNNLNYEIVNNTKNTINKLFIKFEIFTKNNNKTIEQEIINYKNILLSGQKTDTLKIELPKNFIKDKLVENVINIKIYARKNNKAPWTLIKLDQIIF